MNLEQFLHDSSSAGSHDSEGRFSLNLSRAFQKFSGHGGSSPYDFLLRAVQAAVAGRAPELRIDLGRRHLVVSFAADLRPLGSVLTWISGSDQEPTQAQKHLASALLAAPPEWELRLPDGSIQRRQAEFEYSDHTCDGVIWKLPSEDFKKSDLQRHLQARTAYSPIPVYLDGKATHESWKSSGPSRGPYGDNVDLITVYTSGEGFSLPRVPLQETSELDEGWRLWGGCGGWFTRSTAFPLGRPCWLSKIDKDVDANSTLKRWRLSRAIRRPLYGQETGSVVFVIDGVTSLPQKLEKLEGVEVIEHAHWAKTDLSGLSVVQDDAYHAFVSELQDQGAFLNQVLAQHYGSFRPTRRGKAKKPDPELARNILITALRQTHSGFIPLEKAPLQPPSLGPNKDYIPLGFLLKNHTVSAVLAWSPQKQRLVVIHTVRHEEQMEANTARYLQQGDSPTLLPMLEYFSYHDWFHIVFPFQMGHSYDLVLRRATPSQKANLLAKLTRAVETLHQVRGHGGLTPGRVLLTPEKEIRFLSNVLETLEITPFPLGPPQWPPRSVWLYAPPERIVDRKRDIRRNDLFSLGLILYTNLGGAFEPVMKSGDLMMMLHARTTYQLPDIDQALCALTPELRAAITSLLQPEPTRREVELSLVASLLDEQAWREEA